MSAASARVVAFAGRARDALIAAAPEAAANLPGRTRPVSEKAGARADLIRLLAQQRGLEPARADIAEALQRNADRDGSYGPEALSKGCEAAGLMTETRAGSLDPRTLPALALMTSGQVVLVLEATEQAVTLYEATAPDRRTDVPKADFASFYAGTYITGEAPVASLSDRHARITEQRHWFWGEFARFKRPFAEIALGSLVANMLAVAVALFSLQVYDRVIPHQSVATLWVLAAGAGLALMLEGALKSARGQLLDGAGRQIELGVQQTLMQRLLGMRSEEAAKSPAQLFRPCANSDRCASSSPPRRWVRLPTSRSSSCSCFSWRRSRAAWSGS